MNVLITGGSRGIGRACVKAFCERGDRVIFLFRNSSDEAIRVLEQETGAVGLRADISDSASVTKAVEAAIAQLGGIDILVNNAGIAQIKLFTDLTDCDWKDLMAIDLDGVFYVTREVAKHMISRHEGGRIVNIGSMWGKCGASMEVAYSTAKAGIRGFTKALAKELGPSGITVNCVEPGLIETDMNAALDDETKKAIAEETPLCRVGLPEDVANAVLFFASDAASFVTGQILGVDGGYAI
jgi:3-oxoacyl-[acyl-carrier protein] reductase